MRNVRDYAVVTASYWVFTLTDGALRMLVLLYLHELGYTPLQIASLFLFYEFFGIVTNWIGGWLGARFGLKSTLVSGLLLQVAACSLLASRAASLTVPLVMLAQAMSGVAKDLTKMSSKSYIKTVVPAGDERGLLRWVALLTGSKNALKGAGFFLGGLLLAVAGFASACWGMAAALSLTLVISSAMLPPAAGKAKDLSLASLVSRNARVNWLSAARLFLFGSRDVWFVLALPLFLAGVLGWSFPEVGGFLALWVIGYGIVQALAPRYVAGRRTGGPPDARRLLRWTAVLLVPLAGIVVGLLLDLPPAAILVAGLALFGFVFASNSAIHSYLVVSYADADRVSLSVGFYYMANAAGRLVGTLLSGLVFQSWGMGREGLMATLLVAMLFVCVSAVLCVPLAAAERRLAPGTG